MIATSSDNPHPAESKNSGGRPQDPYIRESTRHHLGEILFIAFAGVLCAVRSCEMMEEFAELHEPWLRK